MQQLLGHLMESRLQYYVPETFWKVFKLWGQPVNIREQQDAFDFYTSLIDQLDEQMKVKIRLTVVLTITLRFLGQECLFLIKQLSCQTYQ